MLPLAHMGITITVGRAIEKRTKRSWIDYRLLLVASLLPDLVDKPLGNLQYFFVSRSLIESRALGHSLAFLLLIAVIAIFQWFRHKGVGWLIILFGTMIHDILDVMWLHPAILFWPLYGWRHSGPTHEAWTGDINFAVLRYKMTQLAALENVGAFLLLYFFMKLALNDKINDFIKTGKFRY